LPNVTGTFVTTGDTGTVTSTMLLDGTILNADVNASAAIAGTKISPDFGSQTIVTNGTIRSGTGSGASLATGSIDVGKDIGLTDGQGIVLGSARRIAISSTGTTTLNAAAATAPFIANIGASEVVRIDSSGRLGIGTSAPIDVIHAKGNSTYAGIIIDNSSATGGSAFCAYRNGVQKAVFSTDSWLTGTVNDNAAIYSADGIKFYTNNNAIAKAVFTSGGSLGIGTTAPTSTLHVQHSAQTTGYWEGKGLLIHEDATANQGIAFYSRGSNEQYIASLVDDPTSYLIIGTRKSSSTNNVDAITIRGDGKVGIGTTAPSAQLHVYAGSTTNTVQILEQASTAGAFTEYKNGTSDFYVGVNNSAGTLFGGTGGAYGAAIASYGAYSLGFATNGTERARIDSSGRLLVGTSSTSSNLRALIQATSANSAGGGNLYLARGESTPADGASLGYLGFSDSNHASAAGLEAVRDGGTWTSGSSQPSRLVFSTTANGSASPTERLRITSAGRVGIGTTVPGYALDIQGSEGVGLQIYETSSGANRRLRVTQEASGVTYNATYSSISNAHIWQIGNSETARIDTSGRLLVGTSSDSGGALLQVNGDRVRIATAKTPASASDTGVAGEICWDANYVYVCTATNTWKRTAISTW